LTVKRTSRRRVWFILHGWLGANLALMTALLFLSGTLASVSHEIDWLLDRRVRAESRDRTIDWDQLRAIVASAAPGTSIVSIFRAPERVIEPDWDLPFAARVAVRDPAGNERIVFVDLSIGRVTGVRHWIDFPFLMRQLHYNLFTHPFGFYFNIALGVAVLGAMVTGLVSYRRFWRGFWRKPRWQAPPRVMWGDLHRLVALWSLPFLLIVAVTGVWYLVPDLVTRFGGAEAARPSAGVRPMLPLDLLAARAEATIPGFDIRFVQMPTLSGGPIAFWGQAGNLLMHQRGNRVVLDSATGEVLALHRSSEKGALTRWNDTTDALHFGSFGGLAGRILWCLFGLAASGLILSGTFIRAYRLSRQLTWSLPSLGSWRWVNLGLLFLPGFGLIALLLS